MANLIITSQCNINCSFCFAGKAGEAAAPHMEPLEFQHLVRQLSPGSEIRFCGGEPTLNPRFFEMLVWAVNETANPIIIMTNGIWPDRVFQKMEQLGPDVWKRISVLFNIHRESFYSPEDHARLMAVLDIVYPLNAILGNTIHSTTFTGEYIIRLAKRFNIPTLRYSIAAPTLENVENALIGSEDYRKLAGPVHSFLMNADREGLTVNADCGYIPFCMFTEAQQRGLIDSGAQGIQHQIPL